MNTEEEKIEQPSFLDNYPHLKLEWDCTRNNALKIFPENCTYGSDKKVWWQCSQKPCHVWEAKIQKRTTEKRGCPCCAKQKVCPTDFCNSFFALASPALKVEWHTDNGDMRTFVLGSHKKVWWQCSTKPCHIWEASIYSRTAKKRGCPCCAKQKVCPTDFCNSFFALAPAELKAQWVPENGDMRDFMPSSNKVVSWQCTVKECHKWESSLANRKDRGCGFCAGQKLCEEDACNSLFYKCEEKIKAEWDPENGDMKTFTLCRNEIVGWICSKRPCHKWRTYLNLRTSTHKSDCPFCCNQRICQVDFCNSLFLTATPQLKAEWNHAKNPDMRTVSPNSGMKVHWICEEKHEWIATIDARTGKRATGCPICNNNKSTLNEEFKKLCQNLNLTFQEEVSFEDTKHVQKLNYDFVIEYNSKIIRVELQGYQHFDSLAHFYTQDSARTEFPTRVIIDNKKSFNSLKAGHYFLSISDLAIEDLEFILTSFLISIENTTNLFARYFITKELALQYRNGKIQNKVTPEALLDDNVLLRYQVYKLQCDSLVKNSLENAEPFVLCEKSGRAYLESMLETHYLTEKHKTCKRKKVNKKNIK